MTIRGEASERVFTLTIAPQGDAAFSARCAVQGGAGETALSFEGSEPLQQEIIGDGLHCEVLQTTGDGRLLVEINSPSGNRSRSQTGGANSKIVMRVN